MNSRQKELLQSQLDNEKKVLKELKQVYQQALKDCDEKIRLLSARADMNPDNLQSIIYQKQYQQAIKGQLEGVIENLHSNSYATISDYLSRCYQDGFIGTMYDISGQGIPLVIPIDQEQVTQAIQIDSKLSKSLYDRLGEDTNYLKRAVRAEVSRGIANGSTWNQVASKLSQHMQNTPFNSAYNNAMRIARTEGHRVQIQAANNAQHKAKEKGADIVKQWDASLDGRTRESHRRVDGEIRELDEPFSNGLMFPGDPSGGASEVVNCRCALLQRAKLELDEEELEALKQRAEYFGLDKSDSFDDYKKKYLKISNEDIEKYSDSSKIKLKEDIEKADADIEYLEKQFSDITEGYSYRDWFNDFDSIENGYGDLDSDGNKLKEIDKKIKDITHQKSKLLSQKEKRGQLDTGYSGKIPDENLEKYNKNAFNQIILDTGYSDEKATEFHNALLNYFGGDYETILSGETETSKIIRNGIDLMPTYDGRIYRGMTFTNEDVKIFSDLKQGDILPQKGIIASWSSNERVADSFGGSNSYDRSTVILECVDNKTGVGVQHISKFGDREAEVLSSANYEVVEVVIENKYDYLSKHKELLYSQSDLKDEESYMRRNVVCKIKVKEKS